MMLADIAISTQVIQNTDIKSLKMTIPRGTVILCHYKLQIYLFLFFQSAGIPVMALASLLDKIGGCAAEMLLEDPGEVQGILIAAHLCDLGNGVLIGPHGGQQRLGTLHPQVGHVLQRRNAHLLQ